MIGETILRSQLFDVSRYGLANLLEQFGSAKVSMLTRTTFWAVFALSHVSSLRLCVWHASRLLASALEHHQRRHQLDVT